MIAGAIAFIYWRKKQNKNTSKTSAERVANRKHTNPHINFQKGDKVISLKSINLLDPVYAESGIAETEIIGYINNLVGEIIVDGAPAIKILDVRIPKGTKQLLDLMSVNEEADKLGIILQINEL